MYMNSLDKIEKNNNVIIIVKGYIYAIILSLIFLLIYSIILTNTNIQENTIKPVIITIVSISLLIGSSASTIKLKKNGIVVGLAIGIIYFLTLYFISSIVVSSFRFNLNSAILISCGTILGVIGRNYWSKYKQINKNLNFI